MTSPGILLEGRPPWLGRVNLLNKPTQPKTELDREKSDLFTKGNFTKLSILQLNVLEN